MDREEIRKLVVPFGQFPREKTYSFEQLSFFNKIDMIIELEKTL